jgi:hypothetical protein
VEVSREMELEEALDLIAFFYLYSKVLYANF